jgi:hypothetical protein
MTSALRYTILLPSRLTADAVAARMAALHGALAVLPLRSRSGLLLLDEARLQHARSERSRSPWRGLVQRYERALCFAHDASGQPQVQAAPGVGDGDVLRRQLPARHLIGFTVQTGADPAPMDLFVGAYAASALVSCQGREAQRRLAVDPPRWIGSSEMVLRPGADMAGDGDARRHLLLVIAALDTAQTAGFTVLVNDPTGCWSQRPVQSSAPPSSSHPIP